MDSSLEDVAATPNPAPDRRPHSDYPATLPDKATWYLATDLPRPGSPRAAESPYPPAGPEEIGIRNWIEQSYKQVKDELGRADFQVRSDAAIHRHQTLANCAFSFCWEAGLPPAPADRPARPERGHPTVPPGPLTPGPTRCPQLAHPGHHAATLVESPGHHAPASRVFSALTSSPG
ncbi:hypothetical protein ACFY0A_42360 [Streptomyces sp. NPDC001698]|uniref:hypothetical protein n=1 Tax=unclassified Streptomyces TaxID=2593676 RepID=UPI0036BE83B6